MAQLFQRVCTVQVDSLEVSGLRAQFHVTKTLVKEPNTLDLKVTNLSEHTRAGMQKKGAKVVVLAGYPGTAAIIFSGDARSIDHVKDGAEWVTHVQCGDGERAYQFARFSQSFKPGTSVADVVAAAAKALGIDASQAIARVKQGGVRALKQFVGGFAAHGKASSELDKLMQSLGLTWSIQDGSLQVLAGTETLKGQAILLTPDTGLIGSPDHGTPAKPGQPAVMKVRSLLQPSIRPGCRIQIQSLAVNGQFRVQKVEHLGDTDGSDWYTDVEATPA